MAGFDICDKCLTVGDSDKAVTNLDMTWDLKRTNSPIGSRQVKNGEIHRTIFFFFVCRQTYMIGQ